MENKIKTMSYAWLLVFAICVTSCQEGAVNNETARQNVLERAVGEQIPLHVAERWIRSYKGKTNDASRLEDQSFHIGRAELDTLLSRQDLLGVAFHRALDQSGNYHIIAISVSASKSLYEDETVYIDANYNTIIPQSTAVAWMENYKSLHSRDVWYHFFGADIFQAIKGISWLKEIDLMHAVNDEGKPQLLLVIQDDEVKKAGRSMVEGTVVYDKGSICPPC